MRRPNSQVEPFELDAAQRESIDRLANLYNSGQLERLARYFGQRRPPTGGKWDPGYAMQLSWSPYSLAENYPRADMDMTLLMASPNYGDVHIDTALTNISVAYRNNNFIGEEIFPNVRVQHRTDKWFTFGKGEWFRSEGEGLRGYADEAVEVGYTMSTDSYSAEEHSWQMPLDVRIIRNADPAVAPEAVAAQFVANQAQLDKERAIANLVNTAGNWTGGTTLSGTSQWSDYSGTSDPIVDGFNAIDAITQNTGGQAPNTAVLGLQVLLKLMRHPKILDLIKYGGTNASPAMVTTQALAALWRVDRVLVGQTVTNTAAEGGAYTPSYLWGKNVWFGFVPPNPSLMTPAAGYVFTLGSATDRWFNQDRKALIVRATEEYAVKVTAKEAGYLIQNAIA